MFIESPRFPDYLAYGLRVGPQFSTEVVRRRSGHENRNQEWSDSLLMFDGSTTARSQSERDDIDSFFRAIAKGRLNGFRIKHYGDSATDQTNGRLGTGAIGTGAPDYQLIKRYTQGSANQDVTIAKPVSGEITVYRNASPVTIGASAGNIAIDYTTGIVSFVADNTAAASSITPGATTDVVLANNLGGLSAGQLLYLTGFTGADAALVNDLAHTINSVTGAGPFTFTLNTDTSGKTITLGSGQGERYPQATDTLTWAGNYDVPVRFDHDELLWELVDHGPDGFWHVARLLRMVEIRV